MKQPEQDLVTSRRRIGEVLVTQGLLTPEQLDHVLTVQREVPPGLPRRRLGELAIDLGYTQERDVARALAEALGLPVVDLSHVLVVPEQARLMPRALAMRHCVLVLDVADGTATVAMADPTNVVAHDDVRQFTRCHTVEAVVATASQLHDHLSAIWAAAESGKVESLLEGLEPEADEEVVPDAVEAAPVVRLVDAILSEAVRLRASDVHLEPHARELRVRYRVDGLLRDAMTVPHQARGAVVSRIKIVSGLDISERRRPQDGRARLSFADSVVEARVSTLPAQHGEKVVIRLMPKAEDVLGLAATGLSPAQRELLESALLQPQGLIVITGPTGSGKTATIYSAIEQVSTPERNVVTLEDPVETQIPGITQVSVHERSGMTFARGLRSILRQDPDVVLVGEVRDLETAELVLQASLTGHLVLTTLHTNDAVSVVTRLVDMGVEPFLVASSLSLVVAQRLVRRPCASCAAPYTPDERTLSLLGLDTVDLPGTGMRGTGCSDCGDTGYHGRTGVFEVLPISGHLRRALLVNPTPGPIAEAARAFGMTTLRASAVAAAHRGETTYEEALRVTHVDDSAAASCPTCARLLADDMVCCPWDGSPVGHHGCPACSRTLDPAWSTCPWCRAPVGQPVGATVPAQRAEARPR